MRVLVKASNDDLVIGGRALNRNLILSAFSRVLAKVSRRAFSTTNWNPHSLNWPSSGFAKELNNAYKNGEFDVLQIHWVGYGTVSIEEIGKLRMPIVWRFADQWAFLGSEHYVHQPRTEDNSFLDERYKMGYAKNTRIDGERGLDIDRIVWLRKLRNWKRSFHIVSPSNWMKDCVKESTLMNQWPVTVIPTAMNLELWSPKRKEDCRRKLGLCESDYYLLFPSAGGLESHRKGGFLLLRALEEVNKGRKMRNLKSIDLIQVGKSSSKIQTLRYTNVIPLGYLDDDEDMSTVYGAADVVAIPSVQDNLPGTALEAQSCGRPVVAFEIGGISDIVVNGKTGILVKPFDVEELSAEIDDLFTDFSEIEYLGKQGRKRAIELWDPKKIAGDFTSLYRKVIADFQVDNGN